MSRVRFFMAVVAVILAPLLVHAQLVDQQGDPLPKGAIARLGTGRLRHGLSAVGASFTPDGQKLISIGIGGGSGELSIIEWDRGTAKGSVLGQFQQQSGTVPYLADLSLNGKIVASIDAVPPQRFFIALHDAATGRAMQRISSPVHTIFCLTLSPDGKMVAHGGSSGVVHLGETSTGNELHQLEELGGHIYKLAFSADGTKLAAANYAGSLKVWDTSTGKELAKQDAQAVLGCLAFSPDGKTLAWRSEQTVRLWDFAEGKSDRTLHGPPLQATCLTFAPDGKTLVAGDKDGAISLWDVATGKETRRWDAHGHAVSQIRFAPDGVTIVSLSGHEAGLRLWRLPKGEELDPLPGHRGGVYAIRSFDGERLVSEGRDHTIREWKISTGKDHLLFSRPAALATWRLSPNRETLVQVDHQAATLHQLDAKTGKGIRLLGKFSRPFWTLITPMDFSPDSTLLAYRNEDGGVRVYDVVRGQEMHLLNAQQDQIVALRFAPDGKTLVPGADQQGGGVLGDQALCLWDVATGKLLRRLDQQLGVTTLVFSPGGETLAAAGFLAPDQQAQGVVLWEVATGKGRRHAPIAGAPLAFSPDGRLLAVQDGYPGSRATVRLVETASGNEAGRFTADQTSVWCAAFSPDGRTLATGCIDSSILLWDVAGAFGFRNRPLGLEELTAQWECLAGDDVPAAYRAIWSLVGSPNESVRYLAEKLQPASFDAKRLAALIAALDTDSFVERDRAVAEIEKLGAPAEPPLEKFLTGNPSPEARRRTEAILAKLGKQVPAPNVLRTLRAVHALEEIGTPEATQVIAKLAAGAAGARETIDAQRALERLRKRAKQ